MTFSPFHIVQSLGRDKTVVVVVACEKVEPSVLGTLVAPSLQVDAGFDRGVVCALADSGVRVWVAAHCGLVLVAARNQRCVAEVTVVQIAAECKPTVAVSEVERTDKHSTFCAIVPRCFAVHRSGDVVVEAVAGIAAETKSKTLDASPVDTGRRRNAIGRTELVGRCRTIVYPSGIIEEIAVQRR